MRAARCFVVIVAATAVGCRSPELQRHEPLVIVGGAPRLDDSGRSVEALGLETLGGVFTPLLARGCPSPCTASESFSTAADGQAEISVILLRGNATLARDAELVGHIAIQGIPFARRGEPRVLLKLETDGANLRLTARDEATGTPCRITLSVAPEKRE